MPAVLHAPGVVEDDPREGVVHQGVYCEVTRHGVLPPGIPPQATLPLVAVDVSQLHVLHIACKQ